MSPVATWLDGGSVTQERGLMWLALSASGTVITLGGTTDAGGGITGGTATSGSAFPCRIDPLGGGETQIAGRIDERTTHLLTAPSEVSFDEAQQVAVDGTTFEITAIRKRTRALYRILEVVESD